LYGECRLQATNRILFMAWVNPRRAPALSRLCPKKTDMSIQLSMRYDMKKLIAVLVAAAFAGSAFQAIAQAQPATPATPAQSATPATPAKVAVKKAAKSEKGKKKAKAKGKKKAESKS